MLARDKAIDVLSCADEVIPAAQTSNTCSVTRWNGSHFFKNPSTLVNLSSDAAAAVLHRIEAWLQPDVIEAGSMAVEAQMFCAVGGICVLGTYMRRFPGMCRRILVLIKALLGGQERHGYDFLDDYDGMAGRVCADYSHYDLRPLTDQLFESGISYRAVWCMQSAHMPCPETRELAKVRYGKFVITYCIAPPCLDIDHPIAMQYLTRFYANLPI